MNVQSTGITFARHGLANQDRESHFGAKIFIPAFQEGKLLDSKRTLYYYLKKTESFRKKQKLMKEKALRKHSLHEKTVASVLLKLFISGNE